MTKRWAVYAVIEGYGKRQHVFPMGEKAALRAKLARMYPGKDIIIERITPIRGRA